MAPDVLLLGLLHGESAHFEREDCLLAPGVAHGTFMFCPSHPCDREGHLYMQESSVWARRRPAQPSEGLLGCCFGQPWLQAGHSVVAHALEMTMWCRCHQVLGKVYGGGGT